MARDALQEERPGGHGVAAWFKGMPWLLPMLSVWTGQIQRWGAFFL